MRKLLVAALLAGVAVPAQSALVIELRGSATGVMETLEGDFVHLWGSSAIVSGRCGYDLCTLDFSPSGFALEGGYYHAFGINLDFTWDVPPENLLDGVWHSGQGSGIISDGYIYPGHEYVQLSFSFARMFDDGEEELGDDLPFLELGEQYGVPEPATWAMMIGGFAIAGAALRRKKAVVSFT
jgi:hypothetical protein